MNRKQTQAMFLGSVVLQVLCNALSHVECFCTLELTLSAASARVTTDITFVFIYSTCAVFLYKVFIF